MTEIFTTSGWIVPLVGVLVALIAIVYALVRDWVYLKRAEAELLELCHGDRGVLERLIAFEQHRTRGQSRVQAAKAASYAIRRDNR